ncbi:MAG TPA: radical SAM protein [Stellaceae bacterium]|nr:radical SAM protein [Stellaceae bacterium]
MKESNYNVWARRDDRYYVYNGMSGSLLGMPAHDHAALRRYLDNTETRDVSADLLAKLAVGRMLVPDDADELLTLQRRYETSRQANDRLVLTIVSSLGCNFDCPYCFEAKYPSILAPDVQLQILKLVDDQLPKISTLHVSWFGGEPLLGKKSLLDLSDAFIARCDRAGITYAADIITNGYLLDDTACAELRQRRVALVQVTLDGPPEIHDRMRPLVSGRGSFARILKNLHHAAEVFDVAVRVNIDAENFAHADRLFQILAANGFAGKLTVYPGQLVGVDDGAPAPSATYRACCFTRSEFAKAELAFKKLADAHGFATTSLPGPSGAPCTAVRANELVIGSEGQLYKCWESVGNDHETIGHVSDYQSSDRRLQKWLKFDPFDDPECRGCIALPVCMGGCAHHAMDRLQYENRCSTFRYTYREQVEAFVDRNEANPGRAIPARRAAVLDTR